MGLPENGEGLRGRHVALDHEEGRDDGRRARVAEQAVDEDLRECDKVTADKTEVAQERETRPGPNRSAADNILLHRNWLQIFRMNLRYRTNPGTPLFWLFSDAFAEKLG